MFNRSPAYRVDLNAYTLADVIDMKASTRAADTIRNALQMAAREFDDYARDFAALYAFGAPGGMVTPRGRYQLAEQFQRQAQDARDVLAELDGTEDEAEEVAA